MRRIVTGLFMSLDGVVDADGDWQFPYFDDEMASEIDPGDSDTGGVLMGRRSYEGYDRLRSEHPESPVVAFLDSTPKHVVSTTLSTLDWAGAHVVGGDVESEIQRLKEQPGGDLLLLGSPSLARWLLLRGLLDELHVLVLPIIVGAGVRLFEDMANQQIPLRLTESRALRSGVLVRYIPARKDA